MKFIATTLLALTAIAFADKAEKEEGVFVLTDDNFDETVNAHDLLLVEFYAPWCGHCKKLAPEYAEAAGILAELEEPLYIAKLDATAHEESAKKYGIQGFPTLKLFRGVDSFSDYEGGRTASGIVEYMKKKSGPAAKTLTEEEVQDFKAASDVVVIGYFDDASSAEYSSFMKVADAGDLPFAVVVGSSKKGNSVVLSKDDGDKTLTDDLDDKVAVQTFIGANRLPLLIPFNQDTAKILFAEDQPVKVQVLVFSAAATLGDVKESIVSSASANKGKALYVHVDETNERVFEYFGLSADDFPTYLLVTMDGSMKKYFPESSDFDKLNDFVLSFLNGELKPTLKSDPIPTSQDAKTAYVLVGKAFNDVALDDSKDVMVEFYAPWCGHCKALAPKYDELAEQFQEIPTVIIAKMDATANEVDHPEINVSGFPTLKFFPANSNGKVIDYEGARETDDMYQFIVQNAGSDVSPTEKDEL